MPISIRMKSLSVFKKKIIFNTLGFISVVALVSFFQNCGNVNLNGVEVQNSTALTCPEFSNSKPENIYEDASLDSLKVIFKVNELNTEKNLFSSQRVFDWYVGGALVYSGNSLERKLDDFQFCKSQEIEAKLTACGEVLTWKKSYMKAYSTCLPTPNPVPTPIAPKCASVGTVNKEFNAFDYVPFSTGDAPTGAVGHGYYNLLFPEYGNNDVLIFKMIVNSNFSTMGKTFLPGFIGAGSPVSQISQRDVTLSECPGDFSSSAQMLVHNNADFAFQFTTEPNRVNVGIGLISANKVYYINIKNTSCFNPATGISRTCHLDGQYRNWNQ